MTSRSTLAARPLILGRAADSGAHRHPAQYIPSEIYHHPLPPPLAFCQPLLILWLTTQLPFQVPTPEFLVDLIPFSLSHLLQHQFYFLILSTHPALPPPPSHLQSQPRLSFHWPMSIHLSKITSGSLILWETCLGDPTL